MYTRYNNLPQVEDFTMPVRVKNTIKTEIQIPKSDPISVPKPDPKTELISPTASFISDKPSSHPSVWGPHFWKTLHISAVHYPENPSSIVRERMKGRILAIPYELPCINCLSHAIAFIEERRNKLDEIVSNRHSLGRFYVDFHNKVNKRYGKREWTYEEALAFYSGKK